MTIETIKKQPALPHHFEWGNLPQIDKKLSRDCVSRQLLKICYSCGKGFCKHKGRSKAGPVANAPGRYVCQKCANAVLAGKNSSKVRVLSQ